VALLSFWAGVYDVQLKDYPLPTVYTPEGLKNKREEKKEAIPE